MVKAELLIFLVRVQRRYVKENKDALFIEHGAELVENAIRNVPKTYDDLEAQSFENKQMLGLFTSHRRGQETQRRLNYMLEEVLQKISVIILRYICWREL